MSGTSLLGKLGKVFGQGGPLSFRRKVPKKVLPDSNGMTERWDREWIGCFNTEDPRPFLLPYTALTLMADVSILSAQQVHECRLTAQLPPLRIFMPGSRLVGARIFEAGCGPGLLCKQLGLIANKVFGIDHSALVLHIARLVSPSTCSYYHSSQTEELEPLFGSFDCMVGRFFFIHQNWENSLHLLGLAHKLLRLGGLVGADFLMADPSREPGPVFPAKSPRPRKHRTNKFEYTPKEIEELADATGYRIVETWESLPHQRRFALLARQ
jgi:2-polyprenyl-3-methyl-5-hydroxy-6-metoxy-1,4-benzoquinol methylase